MSIATLVGVDLAYADASAGLQLCLPVVSLGTDKRLYVARRIEWDTNGYAPESGLTAVDDDELDAFATMLPADLRRGIEPGCGVMVVGDDFAKDLEDAGIFPSGLDPMAVMRNAGYALTVMTIESFRDLRAKIYDAASVVFDKALGESSPYGLSFRGRAAMRILQQSTYRQTDFAIRELAAAIAVCDFDVLRRLLARHSIELQEPEDQLEAKANRHIKWCRDLKTDSAAYDSIRAMERSVMHLAAKRVPCSLPSYNFDLLSDHAGRPRETTGVPVAKYEIDRSGDRRLERKNKYGSGSNQAMFILKIQNDYNRRKRHQYMKNSAIGMASDSQIGAV